MLEKICNYFIYLYFSVNYLARDYNLLKTVIDDNIEDLEKYLEYNADINNIIRFYPHLKETTLLDIAILLNKIKIVEFLVSKDANINKIDADGNTPLLLALTLKKRNSRIFNI